MAPSLVVVVILTSGCNDTPAPPPQLAEPAPVTPAPTYTKDDQKAVLRALAARDEEAEKLPPPEPVFPLPNVEHWSQSEPRSLPKSDHGYSIAFDYEMHGGITVTFYQFTRGLKSIPDEVDNEAARSELQMAVAGIQQAVELGFWESAKEVENGVITLGESKQQALWSRHILTTGGQSATSDTYIWSHKNTLFKIRSTTRSKEAVASKALEKFLTAVGEACHSS